MGLSRRGLQEHAATVGMASKEIRRDKGVTCWMKDPPDLPSGLQITSMAALPLVLDSASSGM